MNIVWIEDFGGDLLAPTEATVNRFFRSPLGLKTGRPGWLGNATLKNNPERLEDQCRANGSQHIVRLYSKYWQFWDWMYSEAGLDEADLILIDLNLDDAFDSDRPPPPELVAGAKTAGFKLFHTLTLKHAFPSERIAFLTANAKDVERFNEFAATHHLPSLTCFSKDNDGVQDLAKWLSDFVMDPNVDLRRGMLDGLHCAGETQARNGLRSEEVRLVRRTVSVLMRDPRLLRERPDLVAYAIAQMWDSVAWKDIKTLPLQSWMKHCRNALAHRHFGESISPHQLALIGLVALGAIGGKESSGNRPVELLGKAAAHGDHSGIQHHMIKREVVQSLQQANQIVTCEENGKTIFKKARDDKYPTASDDDLMRLVAFALDNSVGTSRTTFALYAAGLWESIPHESRKAVHEGLDANFDTTFWNVLARATRCHF